MLDIPDDVLKNPRGKVIRIDVMPPQATLTNMSLGRDKREPRYDEFGHISDGSRFILGTGYVKNSSVYRERMESVLLVNGMSVDIVHSDDEYYSLEGILLGERRLGEKLVMANFTRGLPRRMYPRIRMTRLMLYERADEIPYRIFLALNGVLNHPKADTLPALWERYAEVAPCASPSPTRSS